MKWLALLGLFSKELILSALNVAWLVIQPRPRLRPGIIAYPLTLTTDAQITLLANMITLTPGTLSVDVSPDRKTLYIHAIDIESRDKLIGQIAAGFETKVLGVLRKMIELATTICVAVLGLAMVLALIRIIVGPTLADRILGLDTLTVLGIGIIAVFAVRTGLYLYIDIAIALALVGFLSTAAFARYLLSRHLQ